MLRFGLLLMLCTGSLAQVPGFGACPKVEVVQDFNVQKYMGVWYEVQKYFAAFELGGKCTTANYTLNENGSVNVVNKQINVLTGRPSSIEGSATSSGEKTVGKLSVVFPSVPGRMTAPYWILDTDYDNYSVVYSCFDARLIHAKIIWILARKPELPNTTIERAYNVLNKFKISTSPLMKTDQSNCP